GAPHDRARARARARRGARLMHDPPDKGMLLSALARFLVEEIRPQIADPRLNFRCLIAAHLAMVVGAECATEEDTDARELERLIALYPDAAPPDKAPSSRAERLALLRALNARLAEETRDAGGTMDAARRAKIAEHVKATLLATLSVNSPRF